MLVLDANILIRAVLGVRARAIIRKYASPFTFSAPDRAFEEARKYVPTVARHGNRDPRTALAELQELRDAVRHVGFHEYARFEV